MATTTNTSSSSSLRARLARYSKKLSAFSPKMAMKARAVRERASKALAEGTVAGDTFTYHAKNGAKTEVQIKENAIRLTETSPKGRVRIRSVELLTDSKNRLTAVETKERQPKGVNGPRIISTRSDKRLPLGLRLFEFSRTIFRHSLFPQFQSQTTHQKRSLGLEASSNF